MNLEMPSIIPSDARVTMIPAIIIPAIIEGIAYLKWIPNMKAATQPVQAPVTGKGIATNAVSPKASYFSTRLLLLLVRLNSQVKNLSNILDLEESQFDRGPRSNNMGTDTFGPKRRFTFMVTDRP